MKLCDVILIVTLIVLTGSITSAETPIYTYQPDSTNLLQVIWNAPVETDIERFAIMTLDVGDSLVQTRSFTEWQKSDSTWYVQGDFELTAVEGDTNYYDFFVCAIDWADNIGEWSDPFRFGLYVPDITAPGKIWGLLVRLIVVPKQ